tara:strand:+ start:700 stop:885 length:186 start_codon:yes stop_codon:yes gene_type:complete
MSRKSKKTLWNKIYAKADRIDKLSKDIMHLSDEIKDLVYESEEAKDDDSFGRHYGSWKGNL